MLDALLPRDSGLSLGIGADTIQCYFLTALYWSLGAPLIEESRIKFDTYIKKLSNLTEVGGEDQRAGPGEVPTYLPTLYEYYYDGPSSKWIPWSDKVPEYIHEIDRRFNEILVPTVDTVRNTWVLELMVKIRRPVVLVGETGTSKTATTQNFLRNLSPEFTVR